MRAREGFSTNALLIAYLATDSALFCSGSLYTVFGSLSIRRLLALYYEINCYLN